MHLHNFRERQSPSPPPPPTNMTQFATKKTRKLFRQVFHDFYLAVACLLHTFPGFFLALNFNLVTVSRRYQNGNENARLTTLLRSSCAMRVQSLKLLFFVHRRELDEAVLTAAMRTSACEVADHRMDCADHSTIMIDSDEERDSIILKVKVKSNVWRFEIKRVSDAA